MRLLPNNANFQPSDFDETDPTELVLPSPTEADFATLFGNVDPSTIPNVDFLNFLADGEDDADENDGDDADLTEFFQNMTQFPYFMGYPPAGYLDDTTGDEVNILPPTASGNDPSSLLAIEPPTTSSVVSSAEVTFQSTPAVPAATKTTTLNSTAVQNLGLTGSKNTPGNLQKSSTEARKGGQLPSRSATSRYGNSSSIGKQAWNTQTSKPNTIQSSTVTRPAANTFSLYTGPTTVISSTTDYKTASPLLVTSNITGNRNISPTPIVPQNSNNNLIHRTNGNRSIGTAPSKKIPRKVLRVPSKNSKTSPLTVSVADSAVLNQMPKSATQSTTTITTISPTSIFNDPVNIVNSTDGMRQFVVNIPTSQPVVSVRNLPREVVGTSDSSMSSPPQSDLDPMYGYNQTSPAPPTVTTTRRKPPSAKKRQESETIQKKLAESLKNSKDFPREKPEVEAAITKPIKHRSDVDVGGVQERNVKNAINARLNRQKKKEYLESLEESNTSLKTENERLALENKALKLEKREIAEELHYLKTVLANDSALANVLSNLRNVDNVRLTSRFARKRRLSGDTSTDASPAKSKPDSSLPNTTGGVCLHVDRDNVSVELCAKCAAMAAGSEN